MKLWHVAGCSMCLYSLACLYTVPHALCRRQCRTRISEKGVAVGGTAPPIANLSKKTALRWQDPRSSVARPALRWRERAFFFKRREREPVRGHRVREGKRGRHTMTQSAEWPCTSGGTLRRHGRRPSPTARLLAVRTPPGGRKLLGAEHFGHARKLSLLDLCPPGT